VRVCVLRHDILTTFRFWKQYERVDPTKTKSVWLYLFIVLNATFSNISAISWRPVFSGGGSRSTRRKPPTMGKQLVSFITCGFIILNIIIFLNFDWQILGDELNIHETMRQQNRKRVTDWQRETYRSQGRIQGGGGRTKYPKNFRALLRSAQFS
jgi:hypothetical protein